ncbi:Hint domain-containing protein [Asaia lannensis]|uniref:Hint domain-containing protein n=1 Tax=Asaia lannensis TaxID=415421 RepID=UPI001C99E3EA
MADYTGGMNEFVLGTLTTTPCYLPGTLVATPSGPVAVEALSVGDEVLTYQATGIEAVPLCWIGKKTVTATSAEERPVRVRANALADNSPSQDLLITPEHCLFLADHLIPARMLVNGSSIVIDEQDVFEVYHIETEHHAIIMANGALSETYLDTGNRLSFTQEGSLINGVFTPVKSWETDAAAPLGVARSLVEPVFTSLQERAAQLGYVSEGPSTPLTDDPDLHLLTSQGAKIRPIRRTLQGYVFELPAGIDRAWLCSRASRPSDTIGPFVNDRRNLGVLVGTIMVFESRSTQHIAAHLEDRTIEGWQSYENDTCRWTDGRALVQFAETTATSPSLVMIDIVAAGPYHTEPSTGFALSDELRAIA